MSDSIYRQDAIDAMGKAEWAKERLRELPSAKSDKRLEKIAELVDGTIDHFDREDAMDLLYQIKDVLR